MTFSPPFMTVLLTRYGSLSLEVNSKRFVQVVDLSKVTFHIENYMKYIYINNYASREKKEV